mgnify:CR=1 FL=1
MQKQKLFFGLVCIGIFFLFSQCKKETENNEPLPPSGDAETWVTLANEDIQSLGHIVRAIQSEDAVEHIRIEDELVHLEMHNGSKAQVRLDYANYPSPLVGAHLIDDDYYWTIINGTGTSATRLIKDKDRKNQNIEDEAVPKMLVNNTGNWVVEMKGLQEEIADADGKPFRAIGRKSLFNSVSFDIDSNVTIVTNESPNRSYVLPKYRPFTLVFDRAETDVLTIASGFAIAVDFRQVGVEELEFDLPAAWSVTYELNVAQKSGVLQITSPTGMETEFDEEGVITIRAKDQYGRQLERKIPVKVEVGVVNYASVTFTDIVAGVELTGAIFTFAENLTSTNVRDVTAIKAGDTFRLMIPEGFPDLRKVTFTTAAGNFDYYFKPNTYLSIGEQNLSIAPPVLTSYWQGGIIVHIHETLPLSGIASYKITGKVVHVQSPEANINWFPNGNVNVTAASSDTDGAANTAAIISALGGPGTSANYIARWAIRVRDGGYSDWYLGALRDYEYFHQAWAPLVPNNASHVATINQKISGFGGNIKLQDTHNLFWTSTNISTTHAKAYDVRYNPPYTTGQKVYGARGLAFRDFQ